jgi:PAS domain S-box-containing protein
MKSLWTNRKAVEAVPEKVKPELIFGSLIQDAPIAVVALDRNGSVRTWNRAAERMFGWTEEEALGRSTPIVGDSGPLREAHGRALGGETVSGVVAERRTKEGRWIEVGLTVAPVHTPEGEIAGVVEWITDLAAQKKPSQDLSDVLTSLRRAHALASLFDWEMDVRPVAANQGDPLQAHLSSALLPEDRRRRAEAIRDVVTSGKRTDISYGALRQDGGRTCFRERIEALSDESGHVVRVAGTAQDVTEQVYLQSQLRQAERLAVVGRLTTHVVHDFNDLITAVAGHNAMIVEKLEEHSPLCEHALQIQAACERVGDVAYKLLAFSRGDAVRPAPLDLNSIVYAVLGLLQPLTGKNIEWATRLDPARPRVKADSGQIHQALVNLVLNAGDAMPEGGTLTIETGSDWIDRSDADPNPKTGAYALLAVSDTGTGFYDAFTAKQEGHESGFGLDAVRRSVKEAGGWITVHGEPGKGARTEIYLPQDDQVSAAQA